MNPYKILNHIDNKVIANLELNLTLSKVIEHLSDLSNKFKERSSFLNYNEEYLLNNWTNIPIKSRYTTYYVISCLKRIDDINWILSKNLDMDNKKIYKLIILKSKFDERYNLIT